MDGNAGEKFMKDFIFEIYSEEIPARMQKNAEIDLVKIFTSFFSDFEIKFENIHSYVGPCRLAITASIAEYIEAKSSELRGPKFDAPQVAIEGFCKSNNLSKESLVVKKVKETDFYFAELKTPKQETTDIIISYLAEYLNKIIWPKSMTWGEHYFSWVRPVKNLLCLLDNKIIPVEFLELQANNKSFGHKFMDNQEITITGDYVSDLRKVNVVSSRIEREEIIAKSLHEICNNLNITLNHDHRLLEEVAGLTEFPVVLYGNIDAKFMSLPPEVLITSMRTHQKYFTANTNERALAPYFLFVTNLDLNNYSEIIKGNEKVLSARLSDALFFYNSDKKNKLENNLSKLQRIVFHAKLGSLKNKTERIVKLAKFINSNDKDAIEASRLCKCDLTTEMVGEFPELQGIMGSYYAKNQGCSVEVAYAIENHYKPIGADDTPPQNSAAIVSIADKIDSLVSLFLAGERATGSKDPYGLRRYALGIIRTIIANNLQLDLIKLIEYSSTIIEISSSQKEFDEIVSFIEERFKFYLKNEYSIEIINSIVNFKKNANLMLNCLMIESIKQALESEKGKELISLYKRINNIVSESKKFEALNQDFLISESEKQLYNKITISSKLMQESLEKQDFNSSINLLLEFEQSLSKFFDENLVNTEELNISNNRKSLLFEVSQLFLKVAKFDELQ